MWVKLYVYEDDHRIIDKSSILSSIQGIHQDYNTVHSAKFAQVEGKLRIPTDLQNPVIQVEWQLLTSFFTGFNYAKLIWSQTTESKNKYYFITSVAVVNNQMVEISLQEDVLMTYRTAIFNATAIVNRCSAQGFYDPYIDDPAIKFGSNKEVTVIPIHGSAYDTPSDRTEINVTFSPTSDNSIVIPVYNKHNWASSFNWLFRIADYSPSGTPNLFALPSVSRGDYSLGGSQNTNGEFPSYMEEDGLLYLEMDKKNFGLLSWFVQTDDDVKENVKSAIALPFKINSDQYRLVTYNPGSTESSTSYVLTPVWVGDKRLSYQDQADLEAHVVNADSGYLVLGDFTISQETSPLNIADDFTSQSPYSRYELYAPYCGWIEFPPYLLGHRCLLYYVVNYATGSATAYLFDSTDMIMVWSSSCQLGVRLDLTTTNQDELSRQGTANALNTILQVAGGIATMVGGVASENPVAVGMGALSVARAVGGGITNRMNMIDKANIGFSDGGTSLYSPEEIYFRMTRYLPNEEPETIKTIAGRPANTVTQLLPLQGTGFANITDLKWADFGDATITEREEILRRLREGAIF